MTYDRAAIMHTAWEATRDLMQRFGYARRQLREVFARELQVAWNKAKAAAALAARSIECLRAEIEHLHNKTRLGWEGLQRIEALRSVIARKEREAEEAALEKKRALIAKAGGRFCTVTFIKKDGTLRQMRVQPAKLKNHIKGEAASDAGRRAARTRAERHPHLLPVWDAEKGAPRSINLATVSRIAVNGSTHTFSI